MTVLQQFVSLIDICFQGLFHHDLLAVDDDDALLGGAGLAALEKNVTALEKNFTA